MLSLVFWGKGFKICILCSDSAKSVHISHPHNKTDIALDLKSFISILKSTSLQKFYSLVIFEILM